MAAAALVHLVAIAAGALTVVVGAFVLAARPQAWLHRLFFLLAVADGGSTILFRMSYVAQEAATASSFRALYWYFFLAYVVLLVVFGLAFPVARGRELPTRIAMGAAVAGGVALAAVYVIDHAWFWRMTKAPPDAAYANGAMGNVASSIFVAALALVAILLTRDLLRSHSPSHRQQSALVMGGLTLAYGPAATTSLVQGAIADPARAFVAGAPDALVAYWTFLAYVVVLALSATVLLRDAREDRKRERRIVLSCYLGVAIITVPALALPTHAAVSAIRGAAFVCFPALLAYAILRFEVFDIDRQVRRAATVTLALGALAVVFILAQNALEGALQESVFSGLPSQLASGALAAVVVAAVSVPVTRISRKAAGRIVPELSRDALHQRKLEVYRHSLAGALADGLIEDRESRTLRALQESLGITPEEHQAVLAEVRATAASA